MTVEADVKDGVLMVELPDFKDGKYEIKINSLDTRTLAQNRAMWMWLTQIANLLNRENIPTTQILKADIEWNSDKVKNMFLDPVIKVLFNVNSTTKLKKEDYDLMINTMTKAFGARGIMLPEFPSIHVKEKDG